MIMLLVGLLLLAVAIVFTIGVVLDGGEAIALDVFTLGFDATIWGIFLAGVVTGPVALAGLAALGMGGHRVSARRREIKDLRRKVAQQEQAEPQADPDAAASTQPVDDWSDQEPGRAPIERS